MDYKQKYKKVSRLVRRANKERKKQAKKIDILCNDLIGAQREFIKKLNTISFAANFYKSIVGVTELNTLFYIAGRLITDQIVDVNIAFFLRHTDSFELHMSGSKHPIAFEEERLESFFTDELVDNICKSNKICSLDSLFAMGLQAKPAILNSISAATIPLSSPGFSPGFILVYRPSANRLASGELAHITAVAPGVCRVIHSCQVFLHEAD